VPSEHLGQAANTLLDLAVVDQQPFVTPTLFGRDGDTLYLHGSAAGRMLGSLDKGMPACVTATIVDGLVLARSAFHDSINYRSVVALGTARAMTSPARRPGPCA